MAAPLPALSGAARPAGGRLLPALFLVLFIGPVAAGLAGTLLPAFGYLPALGGSGPSLAPFRALLEAPGLAGAVRLSLGTGLLSTVLSLALAVLLAAAWRDTAAAARLGRWLTPVLAAPHLAVAFGLAFLIAPSGWLARLVSPGLTGWEVPPDIALPRDPLGLSLVGGLVLKETVFLLVMLLAALNQVAAGAQLRAAAALGYGPVAAWLKVVLPQVYAQIRLPVYAVLAYGLSNVDMALVLAPGTPPPLAVLVLRWFAHPDLALQYQAAAGAVLQLVLVLAGLALWRCGEVAARYWLRPLLWDGRRGGGPDGDGSDDDGGWRGSGRGWRVAAWAVALVIGLGAAASLTGLGVWSVAGSWFFPDALPSSWSGQAWTRNLDGVLRPAWRSAALALGVAAAALALVVALLERERRAGGARRPGGPSGSLGRSGGCVPRLLFVPLLLPQIGFLFGVQVLLVAAGLDGSWLAVAWSHLLFALPYVYLALADPYRALDPRYRQIAVCLGKTPFTVLHRLTLPLLARPLALAAAIGFSVSIGQYLPTLFAGGGRFATLATEALSLSAGGDRRAIGVLAVLQGVLPLLAFALAAAMPGPGRGRRAR